MTQVFSQKKERLKEVLQDYGYEWASDHYGEIVKLTKECCNKYERTSAANVVTNKKESQNLTPAWKN